MTSWVSYLSLCGQHQDHQIRLRLSRKYHFYYDNKHLQNLNEDELAIVDFMAMNLEESEDPYKDIHNKFVDKSHWKPP